MSAEDRRLSDSVARSVMRITHGVSQWDETMTVCHQLISLLSHFSLSFPIATDFEKHAQIIPNMTR